METPGPTQLSGLVPSLLLPTENWMAYLSFCLFRSSSSLFEQQNFLIYKTKAYFYLQRVCRNLFLLFISVGYASVCCFYPHTHTRLHTHRPHVPLMCVLVWSLYCPTHHPYPHPTPHPQSLWQRGLPQRSDDFVRCICDCHGNSAVAMGTEIHRSIQCVIAHCMELGYLWKLQHVSQTVAVSRVPVNLLDSFT